MSKFKSDVIELYKIGKPYYIWSTKLKAYFRFAYIYVDGARAACSNLEAGPELNKYDCQVGKDYAECQITDYRG